MINIKLLILMMYFSLFTDFIIFILSLDRIKIFQMCSKMMSYAQIND